MKLEKKHIIVGVLVIALLVLLFNNNQKPKAITSPPDADPDGEKSSFSPSKGNTMYNTGIHFYQTNFTNMSTNFMMIMDGQFFGGKFVFDQVNNLPQNSGGHMDSASGWKANYKAVTTNKGDKLGIFQVTNELKGYNERRVINFTTKEITR